LNLGIALIQPLADGFLVSQEPVFLGFEKTQRAGNHLGGFGVVAAIEFALDSLFGGCVPR
jgi:hypothetical protein